MKEKGKAFIPFLIYVIISIFVWSFFYMTEIGAFVLLATFALLPVYLLIYLFIIMWIPYELGKRSQRRAKFLLYERVLTALINAVVYAGIVPFVELIKEFADWGKWYWGTFIEQINPFDRSVNWYNCIVMLLTFFFFLLGEEVQCHCEKEKY